MAAKMTVSGAGPMFAALRRLTRIDRSVIKPALETAIQPMAREAVARTPVATGALRSSLTTKVSSGKGRTRGTTGWSRTAIKYGAFVDLGTKQHPAEGFLEEAFDSTSKRCADLAETMIAEGIDRVWSG